MCKAHRPLHKAKPFMLFASLILLTIFCLAATRPVFSVEDIDQLINQGEEALVRGDFVQVLSLGRRIVAEDPRNLRGYGFALIYCMMTGNEAGFNMIAEEARRQGDPKMMDVLVTKMVAQILYIGGQFLLASDKLLEYETKWREVYDNSR